MSLPPEFAPYQAVYDALPLAERQRIDAAVAKSERAFNFLLGQIMRKTQGRAHPQLARQILRERLDAAPLEVST